MKLTKDNIDIAEKQSTGKLVKHVAIAHSGIYKYCRRELESLGLSIDSIPEQHRELEVFYVYRPAIVLLEAADLFTNLPVTVEHPDVLVDSNNFGVLTKGFTGNEVEVKMEEDGEAHIHSTLTLIDRMAIDYYEDGLREVSPGYISTCVWEDGEHNGVPYQIKLDKIVDVNHLAITVAGRGGAASCIRDSASELLTALKDNFSKIATDRSFIRPVIQSINELIPNWNEDKALLVTCLQDYEKDSCSREDALKKLNVLFDSLIQDKNIFSDIGGPEMDGESKPTDQTTDYAPGATGVAGTGTQEPEKKPVEKPETPVDSDAKDSCGQEPAKDGEPAQEPAKDAEPKADGEPAQEPAKDAEPAATKDSNSELIDLLKENNRLMAEMLKQNVIAKPTTDSKPGDNPVQQTIVQDTAIVNDGASATSAIDDFMKEMRS